MRSLTAVGVIAVVALAGCTGTGVDSLEAGDCFDYSDLGAEFSSIPTVECSEPHEAEVYFVSDVSIDGEYSLDSVMSAAEEVCVGAFEDYVESAYHESDYWYDILAPTQGSWEAGDHMVVCYLYEPGETLTDSVAGSGN